MARLQVLIQTTALARLVLAWFVLSLGVAVASPMIHPVSAELVCSASGVMKLIIQTDEGSRDANASEAGHGMECPLCVAAGAPPAAPTLGVQPQTALSYALRSVPAARLAALVGAPLPARGPPLCS